MPWIKEYSPIEHVSKDDPPIFMDYAGQKVKPVIGEKQADPTHSAVLGLKLAEKLEATGVEVIPVNQLEQFAAPTSTTDIVINRPQIERDGQQLAIRRYLDRLRKSTYVDIRS